jgi:hypothetical protein
MTSLSLVITLTGQNRLSKGHRPQLTSLSGLGLGFGEYRTNVDWSRFQLFENEPKNRTGLDLKALVWLEIQFRQQTCPVRDTV